MTRDLKDQRFDKLTARKPTRKRENGSVVWRCECVCGNFCEFSAAALLHGGDVHSCAKCFVSKALRTPRPKQTKTARNQAVAKLFRK